MIDYQHENYKRENKPTDRLSMLNEFLGISNGGRFFLVLRRIEFPVSKSIKFSLIFQIDLGATPIPKSGNFERMKENINVFDFKLTEDELKYLESFSHFENRVCKLGMWKRSKHYPFHIDF